MVPEDVRRRLRAELHDARQINGTPFVHVNVWTTGNRSGWHCGNRYNNIIIQLRLVYCYKVRGYSNRLIIIYLGSRCVRELRLNIVSAKTLYR